MNLEHLASGLKSVHFLGHSDTLMVNDDNFSWVPDSSVDYVLTDPPFNIARDTNFHTYEKNTINSYRFDGEKGWDSYSRPDFVALLQDWSKQFHRVLRPGGNFAIFCADEYLSDLIEALRFAALKPRRTVTWRKPNAVPVNRSKMMMSACEYIVVGVKGAKATFNANVAASDEELLKQQEIVAIADKAAVNVEAEIRRVLGELGRRPEPQELQVIVEKSLNSSSSKIAERAINIFDRVISDSSLCVPNFVSYNSKSGSRRHPTEKPVTLLSYLIELFSSDGDLILDPFSGSGSLAEAALKTNRRSISVEQDGEFYRAGVSRLQDLQEKVHASLF